MVQAKSLLERERCFQWYQVSSNLPGKLELLPFCLALHCFEGNNFGTRNFGTPAIFQVSLGLGFLARPITLRPVRYVSVKASLYARSPSVDGRVCQRELKLQRTLESWSHPR